jgi:RsiW-degrading membrane proteinase PrsW (M82 family)
MGVDLLSRLLVGVLPVLCFLAGLIFLDSYKLVRLRFVLLAIFAGAAAAGVSLLVNVSLLRDLAIAPPLLVRYVAPVVEELVKGALIVWLVRSRRVGFLVDGAILGFAVGTGFALVENAYYLDALSASRMVVWIVRGFGTAIMHGGATAIFAIISKTLAERRRKAALAVFVPGMLAAIGVHSFFNHFFVSPAVSLAAVLLLLPLLILAVYRRSEAALERWLGVGFDADTELLRLIQSGELSASPVGRYLQSLRDRFEGPVLADMLCYLRLHVELALKAKGMLLMRESGFEVPPDPELAATFDELRFLERSIGRTGRLAILPFVQRSDRDRWQLQLLGKSGA